MSKILPEGRWVTLGRRVIRTCCDCGLTERVEFRIHKNEIQMRGWRDNRRTAARRRNHA